MVLKFSSQGQITGTADGTTEIIGKLFSDTTSAARAKSADSLLIPHHKAQQSSKSFINSFFSIIMLFSLSQI